VWPKDAEAPTQLEDVARDSELATFLADRQWIIDLHEYRASPDTYDNLMLPAWATSNPELRLVAPLLALDRLVGFVVLDDPPGRFNMTYEDRDLLKTVGRHVATHISQHEADQRLADRRQFDAYNQLTTFMMHDIKNSVAQLKLLVTNAARHRHNPAFFDDAISTIANTVERMTRLTAQLKQKAVIGSPRPTDVNELARSAVERCRARQPVPNFRPEAGPAMVEADPEKLTSALEHVIRNAQDATPPRGSVEVRLRRNGTNVVIEVADTGCGMDAEFVRHKLFRAFVTTKGAEGMGIGAFQAREYVRLVGGEVEVQSRPGHGTTFSINLPVLSKVAEPA
jgi:putative PEP-CTERM system histidine kinase